MASSLVQEPSQQDAHKATVHPIVQVTQGNPVPLSSHGGGSWRHTQAEPPRPAGYGVPAVAPGLFACSPRPLKKGRSPEVTATEAAAAGAHSVTRCLRCACLCPERAVRFVGVVSLCDMCPLGGPWAASCLTNITRIRIAFYLKPASGLGISTFLSPRPVGKHTCLKGTLAMAV